MIMIVKNQSKWHCHSVYLWNKLAPQRISLTFEKQFPRWNGPLSKYTSVYNILQRHEENHPNPHVENKGVSFAQNGRGCDLSNVTCYCCNQRGHYANSPECPNYNGGNSYTNGTSNPPGGEGVNALMFSFHQLQKPIPKTWILLDSQSTIDIFCNLSLIETIRKTGDKIKIQCNAGTHVTDLIGDLPGY